MTLEPLLSAPLAIQIHAGSALAAFTLGAFVLFRTKGTPTHKMLGRVWVCLMVIVAVSALFIHETRMIGPFSPLHLLVLTTGFGLWQAYSAIRRGDVMAHQKAMKSLYLGALLLAGAFTLLPGRRLNLVLFGPDAGWAPALISIGLLLAGATFFWLRMTPNRVGRANAR